MTPTTLRPEPTEATICQRCSSALTAQPLFHQFAICPACRWHHPISARRRLEQLIDRDSFRETDRRLATTDPLGFVDRKPYLARLAHAQQATQSDESVITGIGSINGVQTVLVISEFGFLGGSMGAAMGEKVARAFESAIARRLPVIAITASGGARMQEGMLSLVQMATTAAAATRLKQAGLPFISVLTNPTTGGVYASFASLADIVFAEPDALIGFAGPRVFEALTGDAPPKGVQTAESLAVHGWIDAVVDRSRLRSTLATLLHLLHPNTGKRAAPHKAAPSGLPRNQEQPPWETVQLARHPQRPTASHYIERLFTRFVELHGDRASGDDPAVLCGIGDFAGRSVAVVALERGGESDRDRRRNGRARPEGYRKALRVMRMAGQLKLPLMTFIDTPGAWLDAETDARGLAPAIATCLAEMSSLEVPTIAAVIGEGGSGGALALGVADRIVMQENAVYSVIGPEGAAAIIYRDAARVPDVTAALKLTAADGLAFGVIDTVVPEPDGGAASDPEYAVLLLQDALVEALNELLKAKPQHLVRDRNRKFRRMGQRTLQVRRTWPVMPEFPRINLPPKAMVPQVLGSILPRTKRSARLDGGVIQG